MTYAHSSRALKHRLLSRAALAPAQWVNLWVCLKEEQ